MKKARRSKSAKETDLSAESLISLTKLKQNNLVIALGDQAGKADCAIPDADTDCLLRMRRIALPVRNPVHAGWNSLRIPKDETSRDILVSADAPGFIQSEGKVTSQRIMMPGDSWVSGGVHFTYRNTEDAAESGRNILEGRP